MSTFCYKGTYDITIKDPDDQDRFDKLVEMFNDDKDAAFEMFNREKKGETITSETPLFDRDSQLVEEVLGGFNLKDDSDIARLQALNDATRKQLEKRLRDSKQGANNLKKEDKQKRDETNSGLESLLTGIEELDTKEQFNALIGYSLTNLERSKEWLDKEEGGFDASKESHRDAVIILWRQLDTYAGLNAPKYALDHSQLRAKMGKIDELYKDVKKSIERKFKDTIIALIESTSTEGLSRDEIEAFLRESNDIDALQKLFLDINGSTDKLLAVIAKIHADRLLQIDEVSEKAYSRINAAGKKLLDAGIKDQNFMAEVDEKGNPTANIVKKVGRAFTKQLQDLYDKLDDILVGEDGKKQRREYVKKPLDDLSDDEKAHNISLSNDKADLYQFQRPEVFDKKNGMVDGKNKKFNDEFKKKRAAYETYNIDERVWEMAPGITEEQYNKYLRTYYGPLVTAYKAVTAREEIVDAKGRARLGEWVKTGEVEAYETRFVKEQYTEVTDFWDSDEYKAIQDNPAMRDFYKFYKETETEILNMLPADVARKMLNRVFRVKSDIYTKALQKKTSVFKRFIKDIKGLFLPEIITSNRQLGEDNKQVEGIGIFYTSDLKDDERIAVMKTEIESLKDTKDLTEKKKLKDLRNSLLIEENKPVATDLQYDLVENLKVVFNMATAYDMLTAAESTFQIAQEVIRGKDFYEMDGNKPKLVDGRPQVKTTASNVEQRLAGWMRMIFYNSSQLNNSRVAKLGLLLKKYTSMVGVGGLAVFPAINNVVTAEMSNMQEGLGGRFYKTANYGRASVFFAKSLFTGKFAAHLFKQPGQYEDEKPVDLLTALIKHFNFLEENADRGAGVKQKQTLGQYVKSGNVLYALTEGGEYQAQSRSALAYLDNKMVDVEEDFEYTTFEGNKTKTEGKKIALLDAYVFDEASKELKLRPGVIFNAQAKRNTTGEIRNMNKNIHGNHSSVDKVMIQENWYGELAFQFKRWMPNGIRNRFANKYYDESLGMEMEGRYRSVATMLQNMEGMSMQFAKDSWDKLSGLEQANLKKTAGEAVMFGIALALYIIFDAIREGIPPDDEYTRMALNFLKQQADKSQGELTFFISPLQWYKQTKSPVAGLRTFGEVAEFIGAVAGVPYYGLTGRSEKLRYEKGVNKGDLKVWKEFRDLLPLFKQIGQFKQLDVTGDFFQGR